MREVYNILGELSDSNPERRRLTRYVNGGENVKKWWNIKEKSLNIKSGITMFTYQLLKVDSILDYMFIHWPIK